MASWVEVGAGDAGRLVSLVDVTDREELIAAVALAVHDGPCTVRVAQEHGPVAQQVVDMVSTIAGRRLPQRAIRGLQ